MYVSLKMSSRPENNSPPEIYYNKDEALKYTNNSRIIEIQTEMAERALELLSLPTWSDDTECLSESSVESISHRSPYLLLDLGVGSGLSAHVLSMSGHNWIGLDVSSDMLNIAASRQNSNELDIMGDVILGDMGDGIPLRPGSVDGAICISALQWLFYSHSSSHDPKSRLKRFFTTLYTCLRHGSRAVFQFYPEHRDQVELVLDISMKIGFTGGLVIDYPNSTKRKKYFLCLIAGASHAPLPIPKTDEDAEHIKVQQNEKRQMFSKKQHNIKDKAWVLRKKELFRKRGYDIPDDHPKYTARKRRPKF